MNLAVPLVNQTPVNIMEHAHYMVSKQTVHAQQVGLVLTATLTLTNVSRPLVAIWVHVITCQEAITVHACQDLLGSTVINMWMSVLTILALIKVLVRI